MKARSNGFTTIELMIAAAVIGVGVLTISSMFEFIDRTLTRARNNDSADIVTESARKVMSYGRVCMANLGGKSVNFNAPAAMTFTNNEIKNVDETGLRTGAAVSLVSQLDGGLRVTRIDAIPRAMIGEGVDPDDSVAFQSGLIDVKISFVNHRNEPFVRTLVVRTRIKAGVISECAAELQPDALVGEVLCALESGGNWTWNAAQGRCVDQGIYYDIVGNHDVARCNPGDLASGGCDCQPPVGWVNPLPPLVYTFPDGTQTTQGQWPCNHGGHPDPNSCETAYDSRIDTTGFLALAHCRKGGT